MRDKTRQKDGRSIHKRNFFSRKPREDQSQDNADPAQNPDQATDPTQDPDKAKDQARDPDKAKDFKGTIKSLGRYISQYKGRLIIMSLFAVGSTVFNTIGPKILSGAITLLFDGLVSKVNAGGAIDFEKIGQILIFLSILYFLSMFFGSVMSWVMIGITQKTGFRLREEISQKIHRMPMKYFEGSSVGDVLSRITNDVDMMIQGLNQSLVTLITSVTTIIGVSVMMLTISPLMTLIVFLTLPISVAFIAFVMKFSQKYFVTQQEYIGKINGQVEETISGHNIIKLFNHEAKSKEEFKRINDVLFASAWKSQFITGLMIPILSFVGNIGYVGIAIAGGVLAFRGNIAVGDIQAFISYVRNFQQPVREMAQVSSMIQGMAASAERVFEFLDEEEEDVDVEAETDLENVEGSIDFHHVHFGYNPEKLILDDFNEKVAPGMTVAIVGPTGAGKTTLVKLLMRFYDVNSGGIHVDGKDIRQISRENLRHHFGMVLQDTWLFKGTIMDNIRYGRPEATDDQVLAAAKAAHAHHFIHTLPGGYQMELNEDAENISQGQRQLLTIARAILADRPILILDEATSSVDTRTESQIQQAMNNLMKGRTNFVIAHRLSTIRHADLILVMRDGDIVEQGTHEELMEKNGFYAELYNSQFDKVS